MEEILLIRLEVVQMTEKNKKYIDWLLDQKDRDDDLGKLIRKFLKGKNVGDFTWYELRDYLKRLGASKEEINTCERSWVEYTTQR